MVKCKIVISNDGTSLEDEANKLLKPFLSKADGIYTEKQLNRQRRNKEVSITDCDITINASVELDALFDCFWQEILTGAKRSKCTQRQIDFLSLRRYRMSTKDIADATKDTWSCSDETVRIELKQATEKIQNIPEFGIISVLAEVFNCSIAKIKAILFYS